MNNHRFKIASQVVLVVVGVLASKVSALEPPKAKGPAYQSPYSVRFTLPISDLVADIKTSQRGNFRDESTIPFQEWYSDRSRSRYGSWGPPSKHYPPPDGLAKRSLAWKQERVIAVALAYQGYGYQHHHLPDWDPPAGWPWKETRAGANGKGVDCSNFTAFVYNLALGFKPTGAIKDQAEKSDIAGPGPDAVTRAKRIDKPATYADLVHTLHTGDLLFIRRSKVNEISHVVLWIGAIGHSPDETPLIIDSHGEGVDDCNGVLIPSGVYLRPFRERSWYFREADHALRILND